LFFIPLLWLVEPWKSPVDGTALPGAVVAAGLFLALVLFGASVYVLAYRYRRVSTGEQRQQTKWAIFSLFLYFMFQAISSITWVLAFGLPEGSEIPWWVLIGTLLYVISTAFFPLGLTIGVMRFRLYEIDLLIKRTLVYGGVTGALTATYFLSVFLLQGLIQGGSKESSQSPSRCRPLPWRRCFNLSVVGCKTSSIAISTVDNTMRQRC
jgi:hypothetical protein